MVPVTLCCFTRGVPKAQPRPRAVRAGNGVRVYDPGTAQEWKLAIMATLAPLMREREPLTGAVEISMKFFMPRPKGCTAKWHTKKPDADNLAKVVMDACTAMSVWSDDAVVASLWAQKLYEMDYGPGVVILVDEI